MTQRYDVMAARTYTDRDGNEKTAWTKIGTLWPLRDKDGFSLTFDALPIPQLRDDGNGNLTMEVRAVCFPPKEREEAPQPQRSSNNGGGYAGRRAPPPRDLDDEIPF